MRAACPAHLILLDLTTLITYDVYNFSPNYKDYFKYTQEMEWVYIVHINANLYLFQEQRKGKCKYVPMLN